MALSPVPGLHSSPGGRVSSLTTRVGLAPPGGPHAACPSAKHTSNEGPSKTVRLGKTGYHLSPTVLSRQGAGEKVQGEETVLWEWLISSLGELGPHEGQWRVQSGHPSNKRQGQGGSASLPATSGLPPSSGTPPGKPHPTESAENALPLLWLNRAGSFPQFTVCAFPPVPTLCPVSLAPPSPQHQAPTYLQCLGVRVGCSFQQPHKTHPLASRPFPLRLLGFNLNKIFCGQK